MTNTSRKIDPEWIVAIAAIVISLSALTVSIFQTRIMQEQRANSVWPYLTVFDSNIKGYRLDLANKGVGPAIVQDVQYSFDGEVVDGIPDLIATIMAADSLTALDSTIRKKYSNISNLVLAPYDEHLLLDVEYPEADIILRNRDKIGFKLCYCSIEGECWSIKELLGRPEPGCTEF